MTVLNRRAFIGSLVAAPIAAALAPSVAITGSRAGIQYIDLSPYVVEIHGLKLEADRLLTSAEWNRNIENNLRALGTPKTITISGRWA